LFQSIFASPDDFALNDGVALPRLNGKQIYMLGLMVDKFPEFPEFPNYSATLEEPTPLATNCPFLPLATL
jgi:hypothetical protein